MTLTGAPLSVVTLIFSATIALAAEINMEILVLRLLFREKGLTCAFIHVKNYNFFAGRSFYIVPNAGVIQPIQIESLS